jgi:hypothetical protein
MSTLRLDIVTIPLRDMLWVAGLAVGGITLRGRPADTEINAVYQLLHRIIDDTSGDALIGLTLAMDHTTVTEQLTISAADQTKLDVEELRRKLHEIGGPTNLPES